jgi:hypothetical protein
MPWTDERVELLKELWRIKGLSTSRIGVQLGGLSKNAVIGKAHRLKLEPRQSPIKPRGSGTRPKTKRGMRKATLAKLQRTLALERNGTPAWSAVYGDQNGSGGRCSWLKDDLSTKKPRICDQPAERGIYCERHSGAFKEKNRTD